jgi:hypothetical protein
MGIDWICMLRLTEERDRSKAAGAVNDRKEFTLLTKFIGMYQREAKIYVLLRKYRIELAYKI